MEPVGRLAELIQDWKFLIRRDGLKTAFPAVGLDIVRLPYRHLKFLILARALTEPFPNFQPNVALEIRPFDHSDLRLVREIDRPSEAKLCARRLEHKDTGLVAMVQNRLAGYAWGCAEIHSDTERVCIPLEPGEVLCNDAFTNPAFRGLGVQTALVLARFRSLRDLGFCRAICYIETRNAPSLAVWQKKMGSQIVGRIDFIRLANWYRVNFN